MFKNDGELATGVVIGIVLVILLLALRMCAGV